MTRQTISKWELGETSPYIRQAKILSNIFYISLDELVENDVQDILMNKVSNTERLAGIIITILKVIEGIIALYFIFLIIAFFLFSID